jgi:predicted ATPase with chaperone activity
MDPVTDSPRTRPRKPPAESGRIPPATPEAVPLPPQTWGEIGLPHRFVEDLILKMLYRRGAMTGDGLADALNLPFWALDTELLGYQQRRIVEVRGTGMHGRRGYLFDLTAEGRQRVREVLPAIPYVGPAPVPMSVYSDWMERQTLRKVRVGAAEVARGFADLVVDPTLIRRLGPAINAGRSIFLHGDAGNGKTAMAERIARAYPGDVFIPRAILVGGQVIQLFDPSVHEPVDPEPPRSESELLRPAPVYDPRFVRIRRPMVTVGGELTLDQLELRWDASLGVFRAPPQLKAVGGVFLVDDFGRQQVRPRDLLNRWMIPLDRGIDHLSLPNGQVVQVPFDCLVIFATNLDPRDLVEEAFFRRIRHKVRVDNPTPSQYREIFRQACLRKNVPYDEGAVHFIEEHYYEGRGIEPRACHPGDLVSDLCDLADYMGLRPTLDRLLLQPTCESYFGADLTDRPGGGGASNGI